MNFFIKYIVPAISTFLNQVINAIIAWVISILFKLDWLEVFLWWTLISYILDSYIIANKAIREDILNE